MVALPGPAASQVLTNSWTDASSGGRWEDPIPWSLGVAPAGDQSLVLITNPASKTVTIDNITAGVPGVMTVSNLLMSAPDGTTNTLWLDNSGTTTPLRVTGGFALGAGGALAVSNGAVQVDGLAGGFLSVDGSLLLSSGSLISNGTSVVVGLNGTGSVTVAGGDLRAGFMCLGSNATSRGDLVLTGDSSRVRLTGDLWVGGRGSGNTLTVSGGGKVSSRFVRMAYYSASNSNSVWVSGAGSVWSNSSLLVGVSGAVNSVTIDNGGAIVGTSGYVGYSFASSNNSVLVSGGGSMWDNVGSTFRVGVSGSVNSVTISNGGLLRCGTGTLGNSPDSRSNTVLVTGSGSIWSNRANLFVGPDGSDNALTVSAGRTEVAGDLSVGWRGSGNALTVTDGGNVISGNGALGLPTFQAEGSGSNNTVLVTGSGSVWSNRANLSIGGSGAGNTMTVSNGGAVLNGYGDLGRSSDSNAVLVTGWGSVWSNRAELYIGSMGSGNALTIGDGGGVFSTNAYVGQYGGSNNTILITGSDPVWRGSGSVWRVYGDVYFSDTGATNRLTVGAGGLAWFNRSCYFGTSGAGNALTVSNGGTVVCNTWYVGHGVGSSHNTALVTGSGSSWFSVLLYAGQYSAGNALTVSNGGRVFSITRIYIGYNAGSSNNTSLITGPDSVCSNRTDLYVGYSGAGNTLTVSNGAQSVSEGSLTIGRDASATGNRVQISGGRLTVTNASGSGLIVVGRSGGGLLQVDDGTVLADAMVLVTNAGAVGTVNVTGGEMKLTGVGSVIGFAGAADFNVSGGEFRSAGLALGGGGGSGKLTLSGGAAEATGPWAVHTGGLWVDGGTLLATNAGAGLTIGTGGAAQMTVSNGLVRAGEIRIGNGSDGGILTVAGGIVTGGAVVVTSTGVLRLDIPIDSVVSNLGDVQVSASDYTFRGGLHNLGSFTVGGTQILRVQNGLANSGALVLDSGGALTVDAFVESRHEGTTLLRGGASLAVNSDWTNAGAMSVEGGSVTGSVVRNSGLIEGWGSIQASLENGTGGIVRASGGLLSLSGPLVQNLTGGTMEALEGATLGLARDFDNSGIIHNRGGIVDFSGWTLTNSGVLAGYGTFKAVATYNLGTATFSGGTVAVHGQYVNASGQTTKFDRVVASFHGAATNFGNFKNTGGEVTFLDAFYNNGSFDSDPATNVFADLALGPDGAMTGDTQDVWRVGGAFDSATTNTAYNISSSTFEFTNPAGQELEQFSRDLGPRLSALENNWAFGTVRLQGATVTLVERRANSSGPDAVYAAALTGTGTLNVGAGMVFYCGNTSGWSGVVNTSGGGVFRFLLPDAEDLDGDGVNNGNECECGTEPTNALSVLRIAAMSLEGFDACVTWTTIGGKRYVIQAGPALAGGSATNFGTISAPLTAGGSGEATTNLWIPGAITNRFFRVLLAP